MNAIFPAAGIVTLENEIDSPRQCLPSGTSTIGCLAPHLLLLDQCVMTRECLARMLETGCPEFRTWAAAGIADAPHQPYRLVLLNIRSANLDDREMEELVANVRAQFDDSAALAIISDRNEAALQLDAIRYGFRGFIPTTLTSGLAIAAVRLIMAGGTFVPDALISWCAELDGLSYRAAPSAFAPLDVHRITDREQQVLNLLRQGKPNKVIAYDLLISESTVKIHIRNIMRKLNATNRTQLALLFQPTRSRPGASFACTANT